MEPMLCPGCKTNRTRFNLIEQQPRSVKLHPQTGQIEEEYATENLSPFHMPYRGPAYKVQCAVCGLVEDADMFVQFAKHRM
ncbi:DNA alkylation repair protein [Ectobacillus ponti]|uniref:DNA alkylation repair protein n=1 Tax=Ectobacillus ponti TaxID=2961894 RepID=A0AA42BRB0_9BACI|nr:DNA alkylation repair protein [Ectobacillus ponti]MCP8970737.1 DNA alkylation repair protein [Ectobacillus ponti]